MMKIFVKVDKTTEELARQTLQEKWFRESKVSVCARCCFCKDAGRKILDCRKCKLPGGQEFVCKDIDKMELKPYGRVCDLTEDQFQFVKQKLESLISFGAK